MFDSALSTIGSLGYFALFGFFVLILFLWLAWAAIRNGSPAGSSIGFPRFSDGQPPSRFRHRATRMTTVVRHPAKAARRGPKRLSQS